MRMNGLTSRYDEIYFLYYLFVFFLAQHIHQTSTLFLIKRAAAAALIEEIHILQHIFSSFVSSVSPSLVD